MKIAATMDSIGKIIGAAVVIVGAVFGTMTYMQTVAAEMALQVDGESRQQQAIIDAMQNLKLDNNSLRHFEEDLRPLRAERRELRRYLKNYSDDEETLADLDEVNAEIFKIESQRCAVMIKLYDAECVAIPPDGNR